MKASATPSLRIADRVDGVGDRAEKALASPAHQRLDQIVAARVSAVGGHQDTPARRTSVLDRDAVAAQRPRPRSRRRRGMRWLVRSADSSTTAARGGAADHVDQLGVDHRAAASARAVPAARARGHLHDSAVCRTPSAAVRASIRSIGPISVRGQRRSAGRSRSARRAHRGARLMPA